MTPLSITQRDVLTAFAVLDGRGKLHDFGGASALVLTFGWDWALAQEMVHAYLMAKREGDV